MSAKKNKNRPAAAAGADVPVATRPEQRPAERKQPNELAQETMIWILSVLGAIVTYGIVAYILKQVYHPDTAAMVAEAKRLLISPEASRPEPAEAMLFRAAVVVLPLSLLGYYSILSRNQRVRDIAGSPALMVLSGLCVAGLAAMIYYDFAAQNPFVKDGGDIPQNSRDFTGFSNFDFYFDGMFLGSYVTLYTFILIPLLAAFFFFGIRKLKWDESKAFQTGSNVAGYGIWGLLLLACISMSIFDFPYTFENKYNFNAVYYSTTQVYAGAPLLVDGFTNTYGLYPQFLNPVFQVIGLSVHKFTIVMAVLLGLSFALNLLAVRKYVRNNIILFLGMIAVIYFPFVEFKLGQAFDCNFAVYPIRYIIPSMLLAFAAAYLRSRSKMLYWITTVVMAFMILWNPEIGMVSYLAWLAMNIFTDLRDTEGRYNAKATLIHLGGMTGAVVVAFFTYKLLVQAIYGSSPDLGALFGTILVFGKVGFNLLPMQVVHPWNIMALVVVLGFMYSIARWYNRQVDALASMVFLVSVLALGYFFYFQGRSHNWQLAQSSGMAFILLTLLGDELWTKLKSQSVPALNAFFVAFLFLVSFPVFESLFNNDKIREMISQDDAKTKEEQDIKRFDSNVDFITKNSKPHEKVFMVVPMQYQGLYFDGGKRISAFNTGEMDLFLKSDIERFEKTILTSNANVFIEPSLAVYPFLARPAAAIAATYEYKAVNQTMALLTKRQTKVPATAFFNDPGLLVHRKYTDDAAGYKQRVDDAQGISPVVTGPEFSVQMLFFSRMQVFQFASVIGNMNDTAGFLAHNVLNSSDFFFGINGKGVTAPLPMNEWVYCVMNVFPDHVDVYANGVQAGTFQLAAPMKQSAEKMFVGNIGFMHYYTGAIAEVALGTKAMDKEGILAKWNDIKLHL